MTFSIQPASAPSCERMLVNLITGREAAKAHAEAKRCGSDIYLAMRLAPDMLPFASQVRIASDIAKAAVARLASIDAPRFIDDETTLDALSDRVRRTLSFIRSVDPAQMENGEARE